MTDSEKMDLMLSKLDKLDSLESDIQEIKQKVSIIENKVTSIDLTLENEIRVNIKRVAEGHLDLYRNLHNALSIDNEKEMLSIRVNMLETELRKIKERLENIA